MRAQAPSGFGIKETVNPLQCHLDVLASNLNPLSNQVPMSLPLGTGNGGARSRQSFIFLNCGLGCFQGTHKVRDRVANRSEKPHHGDLFFDRIRKFNLQILVLNGGFSKGFYNPLKLPIQFAQRTLYPIGDPLTLKAFLGLSITPLILMNMPRNPKSDPQSNQRPNRLHPSSRYGFVQETPVINTKRRYPGSQDRKPHPIGPRPIAPVNAAGLVHGWDSRALHLMQSTLPDEHSTKAFR